MKRIADAIILCRKGLEKLKGISIFKNHGVVVNDYLKVTVIEGDTFKQEYTVMLTMNEHRFTNDKTEYAGYHMRYVVAIRESIRYY